MSKLAFDYSKWDNLDTDDSDAEPAPKAPINKRTKPSKRAGGPTPTRSSK